MKKSFVYLVVALMLATMLCGCGMNGRDGVIGASPRPTDTIDSASSMIPQVSPTIIPDSKTEDSAVRSTSNPQVGTADDAKTGADMSNSKNR